MYQLFVIWYIWSVSMEVGLNNGATGGFIGSTLF